MSTFTFELGSSLEERAGEAAALAKRVRDGTLKARAVVAQSDGDVRYWDVDLSYDILRRLVDYANTHFESVVGRPPARSFIMVNIIDALKSTQGSGGKWHRDSLRRPQYKAFLYLTDVDKETEGPFCYLRSSNAVGVRIASAIVWLIRGRTNYNHPDWVIRALEKGGLRRQPILAKAGVPFFVNTSLLHRGLPITDGQRIAATVYMLQEDDDLPSVLADA